MKAEVLTALIGGGCGLITGVLGSISAPWAQWGIEKRRNRRKNQADLLYRARELCEEEYFSIEKFRDNHTYSRLKTNLSDDLNAAIEKYDGSDVRESNPWVDFREEYNDPIAEVMEEKSAERERRRIRCRTRKEILEEIAILERNWKFL